MQNQLENRASGLFDLYMISKLNITKELLCESETIKIQAIYWQ